MMKNLWIAMCLCVACGTLRGQVKNSTTEVKDYRVVDGKMIVELMVNGEKADFVLDLGGSNCILPEYAEKFTLPEKPKGLTEFMYKNVPVTGQRVITSVAFGNNAFGDNFTVLVLKDAPYLRKLGVVGVINCRMFVRSVLTIDSRRKKITVTAPYRPMYMKLTNRVDFTFVPIGCGLTFRVEMNGAEYPVMFDTWSEGMVMMPPADFAKITGKEGSGKVNVGYEEKQVATKVKLVDSAVFAKKALGQVEVRENTAIKCPMLGSGILGKGIISIDFMKDRVYFQDFDEVPVVDEVEKEQIVVVPGKLNAINRDYFLENVFDYKKSKEFVFKGDKPVVIDFWATWCGPCMKLMPQMEALAEKYKDRVIFLKVNADKEKELCNVFGVTALPTILFIPAKGNPVMEVGDAIDKIELMIKEQLLKE